MFSMKSSREESLIPWQNASRSHHSLLSYEPFLPLHLQHTSRFLGNCRDFFSRFKVYRPALLITYFKANAFISPGPAIM